MSDLSFFIYQLNPVAVPVDPITNNSRETTKLGYSGYVDS